MHKNTQHIDFCLLGMRNHDFQNWDDELQDLISNATVFSGGKRHYNLVKSYLPAQYTWIEISGNMNALVQQYKAHHKTIIVFTSGDPFFYGFGNTLKRLIPNAVLKVYPYFNSIQILCHKTQTNYNSLTAVSVHGRDWTALDAALLHQNKLIGVLTDHEKTPAAIAKRLLQYGFDNYLITVGEALEGKDERIEQLDLMTCTQKTHQSLNCILLKQTRPKERPFGIPDRAFISLPNRPNMLTKMPIRLTTINALALAQKDVFWDIGACTGSIAIEAKQHFPQLKIVAFEKRTACETIIQENTERLSTPGIEIVIADFFTLNLEDYPVPDVVFIGGHGGRLKELIMKIHHLNPAARIVTNAVKEHSSEVFIDNLTMLNYHIDTHEITVDTHNKISIHAAAQRK